MRFLLVLVMSVALPLVFPCDKFQKNMNLFCKFPGESVPCTQHNALSFLANCCSAKGGCNSMEFPKDKVCCFTQECLNRCYPGKGHKIGVVY
uniref:Defensin-like protein n=1 Tax=Heterorhabditis bacteriophora TaxID=37862 RepID=A0A1I7W785_HETBA